MIWLSMDKEKKTPNMDEFKEPVDSVDKVDNAVQTNKLLGVIVQDLAAITGELEQLNETHSNIYKVLKWMDAKNV